MEDDNVRIDSIFSDKRRLSKLTDNAVYARISLVHVNDHAQLACMLCSKQKEPLRYIRILYEISPNILNQDHKSQHCGSSHLLIHTAASYGRFDVLKFILDVQPDHVNVLNYCGRAPIDLLSFTPKGQVMFHYLAEHDANVKTKHVLSNALSGWNNTDIIMRVVGDDIEFTDGCANDGLSVFHKLAEIGATEEIKTLVDRGCKSYDDIHLGGTPLMFAVMNGHIETVRYLCDLLKEKGSFVDQYSNTLLHRAAQYGCVALLDVIIPYNRAHIHAINCDGDEPFHLALRCHHYDVAKRLVEEGSMGFLLRGSQDAFPVHQAAKDDSLSWILERIVDAGRIDQLSLPMVAKDGADHGNVRPICLAVEYGALKNLEILLRNGVSVNAEFRKDKAPVFSALTCNQYEAFQMLVENGANVNVRCGQPALLTSAITRRNTRAITALYNAGLSYLEAENLVATSICEAVVKATHSANIPGIIEACRFAIRLWNPDVKQWSTLFLSELLTKPHLVNDRGLQKLRAFFIAHFNYVRSVSVIVGPLDATTEEEILNERYHTHFSISLVARLLIEIERNEHLSKIKNVRRPQRRIR